MNKYDIQMGNVCLDVDADLEDIFCALNEVDANLFDLSELEKLHASSERMAEPRQLGDWITITVDADNKSVHCNCEQCNRYGLCCLSATMRVIQFDHNIPQHCKKVNEGFGWQAVVMRARRVMKDQNICV